MFTSKSRQRIVTLLKNSSAVWKTNKDFTMSDLLIKNARVLQVLADKVTSLEARDILIKGKRIQAIQPTGKVDSSQFDRVLDARGSLAIPGLINTHAHVPM